jgi:predicted PurR-regulated permease PerM
MAAPRREIVLPRAMYIVGAILLGGYVVYWLRDVLTPIFLAFSLAYLLDPLVDQLEAWHVPRPAGIALVLGGGLGAVALFLGLVVPGIAADVAGVIRELPTQLAALWARLIPWLEQRGIEVPHSTTEWAERLRKCLKITLPHLRLLLYSPLPASFTLCTGMPGILIGGYGDQLPA